MPAGPTFPVDRAGTSIAARRLRVAKSADIREVAYARPVTAVSGGRRLASPVFWVALAVLLVNDHVLKHSAAAGWLTGKLSDLAGLIVAPVLAVSLARARVPKAMLACFVLVTATFVAIKVSVAAANAVTVAMSWIGVPWRIWTDPTDLIALGVLPLAWRCCAPLPRLPRAHPGVERFGAIVGALACVATSTSYDEIETSAFAVNLTHDSVRLQVWRVAVPLDCAGVARDPAATLQPAMFAFDRCRDAEPMELVPLDRNWRARDDDARNPEGKDQPDKECDAVVIRANGMRDTVVFWDRLSKTSVLARLGTMVDAKDLDEHALCLESFGESVVVESTPAIDAWPVEWTLPPEGTSCSDAP